MVDNLATTYVIPLRFRKKDARIGLAEMRKLRAAKYLAQ